MKKRSWIVATALLLATTQIAEAQSIRKPAAVKGQCAKNDRGDWVNCEPGIGLSVMDEKGGLLQLPEWNPFSALKQDGKTFSINGYGYETSGFSIFLSLLTNPDPFVTYGLAVTNNTNAALSFLFTFSSPYVGGPYNAVTSSHSSSYTRRDATNSSINAFMGTDIHRPFVDGNDVTGAFIAPSCAVVTPPISGSCTYPDVMNLPYNTAAAGNFGVRVGFTMPANANRLVYTANGEFELTQVNVVPEPSAFLLVAAGMFVMGVVVMQRRRTS